jgi:hypothetical protein
MVEEQTYRPRRECDDCGKHDKLDYRVCSLEKWKVKHEDFKNAAIKEGQQEMSKLREDINEGFKHESEERNKLEKKWLYGVLSVTIMFGINLLVILLRTTPK